MNEEFFYREKIFNKVGINRLKKLFPGFENLFKFWYKSDRYKVIQGFKSFLNNKINSLNKNGERLTFTSEQLYNLFLWWEKAPKVCHYCTLPESSLTELQNNPGHINK